MASTRWPLGLKLQSDFALDVRSRLDRSAPDSVIVLTTHLRVLQAPVLGGDTGLDALVRAGETAVAAVHTGLGEAGTALRKAVRGVARAFGLSGRRQPPP